MSAFMYFPRISWLLRVDTSMTYLHVIIAYLTDDIKWTSNKTYLTQNASSTHGVDLFGDVKKLHCGVYFRLSDRNNGIYITTMYSTI
jgi:uncharacterized membrane protein